MLGQKDGERIPVCYWIRRTLILDAPMVVKALSICIVIFALDAACAESPDEMIRTIAASRNQLKVIACEVEVEAETRTPPNWDGRKMMPAGDPIRYSQVRKGTIDFGSGRFRWDYSGTNYQFGKRGAHPYRAAKTYDGEILRSVVYPTDGKTNAMPGTAVASDFAEFKGDLSKHAFEQDMKPFFMSHGILPAANQQPLYPGRFHSYSTSANTDTFRPSTKPANPALGVWLDTIMQSSPLSDNYMQYCFDPKRNFALVYAVRIIREKVVTVSTFQYRPIKDSHRLIGWTYKSFDGNTLIDDFKIKVLKLDLNQANTNLTLHGWPRA